jgi:Fe2+ transport system protein FeoA
MTRRLTSLGFTPGVEVYMVQNFGLGPLIVLVRGTRVALGRGEAHKIQVERKPI